jgi:hypothetical protein
LKAALINSIVLLRRQRGHILCESGKNNVLFESEF